MFSNEIEEISKIKIKTKIKNDEYTCKVLLYTIYYAFEEYPQIFDNMPLTLENIKNAIEHNYKLINNGADPVAIFYYLNSFSLKDTNFGLYYQTFLNIVDENKKELGEYTLINIYNTLIKKMDIYFYKK